jgi:hypothetical protein
MKTKSTGEGVAKLTVVHSCGAQRRERHARAGDPIGQQLRPNDDAKDLVLVPRVVVPPGHRHLRRTDLRF